MSSMEGAVMKSKALGLLAVSLLVGPAVAHGAIIFQDNFDADSGASVLNFSALANWTVGGGTIDYIRNGGFGISCVGGTGGCLDMDGSSGNAGRITSTAIFNFDVGTTYTLSAQISGNQRGGAADSILIGFIDTATSAESFATLSGFNANDPFALREVVFSGFSGTYRLFFEGVGGDNIGVILDNVVFSSNGSSAVPEPGTLGLLGLGLAGMGLSRRRKSD
jgi:hypothetical protein